MSENLSKSGELSFHGIDYLIKLQSKDDSLSIEIEQKTTGDIWKSSFTSDYIEEITQKTGNFKKFPVFLKMLITSLSKNSDSVFLDILTYQDLQVLKARKQSSGTPTPSSQSNAQSQPQSIINTKRYLILTYVVEFDKVHYPLPLSYVDMPDVEALKNTIRRLRTEIEEMGRTVNNNRGSTTGNSFFSGQEKDNRETVINSLRLENEYLRQKVKKVEEDGYQKKGAVEYDMIIKAKIDLESELESLKSSHSREIIRLSQQNEGLEKELQQAKLELLKLQHEFANSLSHPDSKKRLTDHILKMNEESESELFSAKKTLNKQEREMERLINDLDAHKQLDKKQRLRIKQLEMDLENALKKTSTKGISERLFSGHSRSRGNSPALSSKRSVSVPQKKGGSGEKLRKNSTNLSTLSNKNRYSRENSLASSEKEGFIGRWNRRGTPEINKKNTVTPVRKPINSNSSSSKDNKIHSYNNFNKKNLSISNKNSSNIKKTTGNSGKKNYEKPWLTKKSSPLPKLGNSNNKNRKNDEDSSLYKKLEDLRNKNKKKEEIQRKTPVANKENSETNIDERLNKLQNLLKIAKN